ncbi:MAG TPA: hypothetical protein VJ957_10895 [Longimicrobiales bacterium]|nr:hypothetical protein [Longimicrobiales bacterium]
MSEPGKERYEALREVLEHEAEMREVERKLNEQPKQLSPAKKALLAVLIPAFFASAAAGATVLAPKPLPAPTAQQAETDLRAAMFLQAERIEAYIHDHGQLPARLADAGSATPGVEYRQIDSTAYELVGTNGPATVHFRRGQSLDTLLGSGAGVLQ